MNKINTYVQATKEKIMSLVDKISNLGYEDEEEVYEAPKKAKKTVKKSEQVKKEVRQRTDRPVRPVSKKAVRPEHKSQERPERPSQKKVERPVKKKTAGNQTKEHSQSPRLEKGQNVNRVRKTKEVQRPTTLKEKVKYYLKKIWTSVKRDFRPETFKKCTHVFIFPLVFIYFEVFLRIFGGTSVFSHLIYPVLFGLATGFLISFITLLFRRPINRKISIVVLFVSGLLFTAECLVKRSFQWYLPISGILGGAGDVAGDYFGEAIKALLAGIPAMIIFFLPAVLYLKFGKQYVPAKRFKPKKALRFLGYSVFFMLAGILTANIGSSAAKYKSQYKFDTATEYFGLLTSLRLETKYSLLGNNSANQFVIDKAEETEEKEPEVIVYGKNEMDLDFSKVDASNTVLQELNTYVQSLKPSSQNAYTGIFKDKNLILICAEAFSDVVIHKELTPTLYRMAHKGFYFSEFYQPSWGGSTTTGEYSFVTGLVPLSEGASMKSTVGKNAYFTMGNQMQRLGYTTYAYHSGTYDFYSRELTHENLGYNQYIGMGNGMEELTDWNTDDTVLFEKTMDVYMSQAPFSIYYMTLSGHCIYEESRFTTRYLDTVKSILGEGLEDKVYYYYCYQMELEKALTLMIEKLEAAGIADDTVICMTSDHYPYGLEDTATFGNDKDYLSALYGYVPEYPWEKDRNSWIIWSGCLENEYKDLVCEISTPTYSLDILPTMSNLFGLEYDSRLLVGRDVFSDQEPLVLWNNYSWATERGKYDARSATFYPNEGYEEDYDYVSRINNSIANKIAFSNGVFTNDYYGELFGEDTVTVSGFGRNTLKKPTAETQTEETAAETETEDK